MSRPARAKPDLAACAAASTSTRAGSARPAPWPGARAPRRRRRRPPAAEPTAAARGRPSSPSTPSTYATSGAWRRQRATTRRTSSSLTHAPWMRWATLDDGPSRSMSPLPTRRSAPGWSRMTRLSVRLDTAKARRAGMLALMTPVMTFTDGRWVAIDEVDADGPGHLGDAADRLLDVAGRHHHEVVELVDHDEDERQALVAPVSRPGLGPWQVAPVEGGVVAGDVAEADLGQQVVAALHLLHRPRQRVGRLLRVGDDLGEQVGQPVVLAHLDPLRVDEDHAHLVGRGAHQDRRDERVDAARLAGAGGAGDEQVGHRGQVDQHRPAVDVLADGHLERVGGPAGLGRRQDVAEGDELAVVVGDLDADGRAAGDGGQDAHVGGGHARRRCPCGGS